MRNLKRLLGAVLLAAGVTALVAAPTAGAAPSDTQHGTAVTHLGGLALRPVHVTRPKQAGTMSAQAAQDVQAYLISPVSDLTRCLDADLNTIKNNGAKVQLWTCDATALNQGWMITALPEGHFRFQNAYNGKYLDADLNTINSNGTKLQLWDYVNNATNQWFDVIDVPDTATYFRWQNVRSGRYVDADSNTANRDGGVVQLWDYTTDTNLHQQWS